MTTDKNRLRNRVEQQRWKIRQQGKQILDLVAKLNDHNAHVRQVIRWQQMQCDETAAKFAEDESETGQQMYWRADGASDALDWLVSQFPDKPVRCKNVADKKEDVIEASPSVSLITQVN